jgi:hypothetical protein
MEILPIKAISNVVMGMEKLFQMTSLLNLKNQSIRITIIFMMEPLLGAQTPELGRGY